MYGAAVTTWGAFFMLLLGVWIFKDEVRERFQTFRGGIATGREIIENNGILYDTFLYVEAHANATLAALIAVILCFIAFLPSYINFKEEKETDATSIYQNQYAYVTTSAFLRGYQPAVTIFMLLTVLLLLTGLLIFHSQYEQVDSLNRSSSFFSFRLTKSRSNFSSFRLAENEKRDYTPLMKAITYLRRIAVQFFVQAFNLGTSYYIV